MSLVAIRYAEALLELSDAEGSTEAVKNELAAARGMFENNRELYSVLLSPEYPRQMKQALLGELFGQGRPELMQFYRLLLDHGRIKFLPDISRAFEELAAKSRGHLTLVVRSAQPIDGERLGRIGERFRKMLHAASAAVTLRVEPALIGGIQVSVNGKIYDGTLKGKLSKLQSILAGQ